MSSIIKALRVYKGYFQNDVAIGIGMSKRSYVMKENNPKLFTVGELEKLAEFLNVKKEIFFKQEVSFLETIKED